MCLEQVPWVTDRQTDHMPGLSTLLSCEGQHPACSQVPSFQAFIQSAHSNMNTIVIHLIFNRTFLFVPTQTKFAGKVLAFILFYVFFCSKCLVEDKIRKKANRGIRGGETLLHFKHVAFSKVRQKKNIVVHPRQLTLSILCQVTIRHEKEVMP